MSSSKSDRGGKPGNLEGVQPTPSVVVFDVNETVSDLAPLAERFAEVGAPKGMARLWFARVLRDGLALAATGDTERFAVIGAHVLRGLFAEVPLDRDLDEAVGHVLDGFAGLPVHPDIAPGVRGLTAAGLRLVTLSNGSTGLAEALLAGAGLRDAFEALLSVDDAGAWKPARGVYEYAAHRCGAPIGELLLVAVHPWDLHGAARAGMRTAWLNRTGAGYPGYFTAPEVTVSVLDELPAVLSG